MRKQHGQKAIGKKTESLYIEDLLVYGESRKDKAAHKAYQFENSSSDYGWSSEKSVCPVCGGDGGANGQCYKCEGSGWA
ncbi:MAG: hypothetical protein U1F76_15795 [Candidatus Competibacteraceae bacterium]